jgi:hypothetical protein
MVAGLPIPDTKGADKRRMTMTETMKPNLKLVGLDGNAFSILGRAKKAADKAKMPAEQWAEYKAKAMSGDYDNLLQVTMEYFEVS